MRVLAAATRVLVGYSDAWVSALVPATAAGSLVLVGALSMGGAAGWTVVVLAAMLAIGLWLCCLSARRVSLSVLVLIVWGAVAAGVVVAIAIGGGATVTLAAAGIVLAAVGLLLEIILEIVGAFGPGRSTFALRPLATILKLSALAACAAALVYVAGTIGAAGSQWLIQRVVLGMYAVPSAWALLVAGASATYRPPVASSRRRGCVTADAKSQSALHPEEPGTEPRMDERSRTGESA